MEALDLIEVFNSEFKFQNNQSVRHKGDKKEYGMNDMGLLIIGRYLVEEFGSNSITYKRQYLCRIVAYSGSGNTALFNENELQSVEDWRKNAVSDETERNLLREDVRQMESDIMKQFGLENKSDRFNIVVDGKVDKEKEYRMSGFKSNNGKYEISVRQTNTLQTDVECIYLKDKSEIVPIDSK